MIVAKVLNSKPHLQTHRARVHSDTRPFECQNWLKTFKTILDLGLHDKRVHQTVLEQFKYICQFCSKAFYDKAKHNRHEEAIHIKSGKFQCQECLSCSGSQNRLNIHMKTHQGIKDFVCSLCGKAMTQSQSLKKHMITVHDKLKPFKCNFCTKSYGQSQDVKKHIQRVHS